VYFGGEGAKNDAGSSKKDAGSLLLANFGDPPTRMRFLSGVAGLMTLVLGWVMTLLLSSMTLLLLSSPVPIASTAVDTA
jgi:hypothetical protein